MPRSKVRKGRRIFRPKPRDPRATYGVPDPLALFRVIGRGELCAEEEDVACKVLLADMRQPNAGNLAVFDALGLPWPPTTTDDIRAIARTLVATDSEEQARAADA